MTGCQPRGMLNDNKLCVCMKWHACAWRVQVWGGCKHMYVSMYVEVRGQSK